MVIVYYYEDCCQGSKDQVMLQHMLDEIQTEDPFETGVELCADLINVIKMQVGH